MLLSGRLSWMRYILLRRRLFERGALFLAVSDAVRARAIRLGYPAGRTVTLHNGVDIDYFTPAAEAPEPGLILHVGRLVEKKGTRLLLEALPRCPGELASSATPDRRAGGPRGRLGSRSVRSPASCRRTRSALDAAGVAARGAEPGGPRRRHRGRRR